MAIVIAKEAAPPGALDAMRGIAAQTVLLVHAVPMAFPAWIGGPVGTIRGLIAQLAVVTFFVLSGFVIAASLQRRTRHRQLDLAEYAVRRIARIWPPFLTSLLLVAGLVVAVRAGVDLEYLGRPIVVTDASPMVWLRAVLLYPYSGTDLAGIFNSPVWSLRLEVRLYLIAGLVAACWVADGPVRWIAAAVLAYLTYKLTRLAFGLPCLILFSAGSAAALFGHRLRLSPRVGIAGAAAVALLMALGPAGLSEIGATASVIAQCTFGAALALALMPLSKSMPATANAQPNRLQRAAAASGAYSYSVYILHFPLLIALNASLGIHNFPEFAVAIIGINAVCWAVAQVAERTETFAHPLRSLISVIAAYPTAAVNRLNNRND